MKTSKLLKKAAALSALPLLFALATTQVGCLGHAGPSEIAQGKSYQSGDPTYDQFFQNVHELSLSMSAAPKKESQLRMALAKELGVEPEEEDEPAPAATAKPSTPSQAPSAPSATDAYEAQLKQSAVNAIPGASTVNAVSAQVDQAKQTIGQFKSLFGSGASQGPEPAKPAVAKKKEPKAPSAALIAGAVKSRSKKLGVEMKLSVDRSGLDSGDAKTQIKTSGESADGQKLAKLVDETAKGELELVARMKSAKKKLEKLASVGAALEASADASFRKSRSKASEVKKNLADARALIELMDARASEVEKKANLMLEKLEQAASADLEEAPATQAVAAATEKKEPAKAEAPKAEPPKAAKSDEPSKAKPKAKPRGPARPSKTAMADFEP